MKPGRDWLTIEVGGRCHDLGEMGETTAQQEADGWRRFMRTEVVPGYRVGWLGVWDSFSAAVTRRPRSKVAVPVTFSVYVKCAAGAEDVAIHVWGGQLEEGR